MKQSPPKVIPHKLPSEQENPLSKGHIDGAGAHFKTVGQRDPGAVRHLPAFETRYKDEFRKPITNRGAVFTKYYGQDHYRYYYSKWFAHGFYGGYWYPVRPCYDAYNYFEYPLLFWLLYSDNDDGDYWSGYYPGWYYDQPIPPTPQEFPFAGVFFPTDTLRDLGMEISMLDPVLQNNFQTAIIDFLSDAQDDISAQLQEPIQFEQFDVVVNHYQNLQDEAIVIEGFANVEGVNYAFKAFLDLVDPNNTIVFVPSQQNPDGSDTTKLDEINQRIIDLGGDPYAADQEPLKVPASLAISPQ